MVEERVEGEMAMVVMGEVTGKEETAALKEVERAVRTVAEKREEEEMAVSAKQAEAAAEEKEVVAKVAVTVVAQAVASVAADCVAWRRPQAQLGGEWRPLSAPPSQTCCSQLLLGSKPRMGQLHQG